MSARRALVLVVGAIAVSGTQRLAAQSVSARAALVAWGDSLDHATTRAELQSMASQARGGRMGDLRLAAWQLREGALTRDRGLTELALIRLDGVAAAHRDWPAPEVLIARTFIRLSDSNQAMKLSAGLHEGESYVEAAWRHLRYALAADASDPAARGLALDILVPEGDRELRGDERAALRTLRASPNPEAATLLVAGRDFRTHRNYDSALVMFGRALAAGGDRSVIAIDGAHTLSALGDTAGAAAAYWDGLHHLSPAGREAYRYDLAWITAPDSLAPYDAVPIDSVGDWVRRFWAQRDAESANRPGDRLQEHFRRWTYAFERYRVAIPWRHNQFARVEFGFEGFDPCVGNDSPLYDLLAREQPSHPGDVRHREPLLDHRGLIYLHHGQPYRVAYGPGHAFESDTMSATDLAPGIPTDTTMLTLGDSTLPCARMAKDSNWPTGPNEAWLYWIDGAWRVMNFRGSCALGRYAATTLTSYLPVSLGDYLARADLTADYHNAALRLLVGTGFEPSTCVAEIQAVIKHSRVDADVGTRTDSHTPYIARPWNAVVQAFALGGDSGRAGEGLVTFAIPVDSLRSSSAPNGELSYAIHARITGYERGSGRTFAIDTVRRMILEPAMRTSGSHLSGWFEIALDPGDWDVGVRMNQGIDSIGTYALARHLTIADGTALALSDIVTGAWNGVAWTAPDGADFPVNVLGGWTVGGSAELYYEVRGLAANAEYHTVIEVRAVDGKSRDQVRVESSDRATGPTSTVRKSLGLVQLGAGEYRLLVTVGAGGRQVTREQRILVVKRK